MKEENKLVPKLRFPEFRDAWGWECEKVDALVYTITPPKKLPTSNYGLNGAFPIIDQSQNEICGWTDDHEALIQDDLPFIIFGDHTCILKFVRQPFAQGADGIKILKSRSTVSIAYLYQYLNYQPVVTEEYKRHFSILKEKVVSFPDFKTGEQQKIAECLSSLDELIAAQARKVDALKTHKKGLMQQLFPREGETQPRLRFPEFRGAGDWDKAKLGDIVEIWSGNSPSKYALSDSGEYAFVKVEDLNNCTKYQNHGREYCDDSDDVIPIGAILFPKRGASIELNKIRITESEILIDTNLMALSPAAKVKVEFLYYFLVNVGLAQIADLSTIPQINNKHIIPFKIVLPSKLEQQRIADCLTSLDDLITAATQELETLKTHKKGLMQQLFPSAAELAA